MKIAIASDHAAYEYKKELSAWLKDQGHQVLDFGTYNNDSVDYPDFAFPAAESVASGESDFGCIICGSGIGMSIVSNKVTGVRAALCMTPEMAELARRHNNANVINFGQRLVDLDNAKAMLDTFINTDFDGGRHQNRVDKIHNLTGR